MNKKIITLIILVLLSVIGYVIFSILYLQYTKVNIAPEAVISVFHTDEDAEGKMPNSIIDENENTWWYGYVGKESPNWVELEWRKAKQIHKILINFGGDRRAVDYKIQIWNGVSWQDIRAVNNNQHDTIIIVSPAETKPLFTCKKMRFYVTKTAQPDGMLRIAEFYVYVKQPQSINYNIAPKATVIARQTESIAFSPKHGGDVSSANDSSELTWWYGYVDEIDHNWLILKWSKPQKIDKIKIVFGSGRWAVDYKIQRWENSTWKDFIVETANKSEVKIYSSTAFSPFSTQKIRIYITKTNDRDQIQKISEIYVYKIIFPHPLKYFFTNIISRLTQFLSRFEYSFGFFALFFIPSFVLLCLRQFSFLDPGERFVLSFVVTILFLFIIFLLSVSAQHLFLYICFLVFLLFLFYIFFKHKIYGHIKI